ncbi:GNAT family N-acetyltransferase [Pelagibacterium luteolum]|uniref:Ribosomal-protein-alanine N-acetyltransferase n=1 Tax=Pelagibacterium luteolum TaxID=440168 RepID=A0A1G7X2Y5_9HYPH|nr:GNAT family N-acetyltransferase [Pelagibacterium luteolum]SDG78545.1 ribosomal-protein-alanine N-acetyltransferase [Pelagibacterium luteolum]
MLEQLNLRRASIAEADKLGRLAFAAWDSSMRHVINPESEEALDVERAALELSFQLFCITACNSITVAEHDGALVGWGAREPMSDYISDLWVAPPHQRNGIGRALLSTVEQDIFRSGHDVSVLETHAENGGAIRFYAREGYGIVWRGMKFSRMLGQRVEKVRMEKQLVVTAH